MNMSKCYAQGLAHGECWVGQLALLLPPAPWRCINLAGLFNPDVSRKPPCSCMELKFGAFPSSHDWGKSKCVGRIATSCGSPVPTTSPRVYSAEESDAALLLFTTNRSH